MHLWLGLYFYLFGCRSQAVGRRLVVACNSPLLNIEVIVARRGSPNFSGFRRLSEPLGQDGTGISRASRKKFASLLFGRHTAMSSSSFTSVTGESPRAGGSLVRLAGSCPLPGTVTAQSGGARGAACVPQTARRYEMLQKIRSNKSMQTDLPPSYVAHEH